MAFMSNNLLVELSRGNYSGGYMVHKFGRNGAVPNGSWVHVSQMPFAVANFQATAVAVRVKAGGNAADTAAGNGAREITIQGIDENHDEVSEAVATAGASASDATTTKFLRVHRAWVSASGTYGAANTANVVIETTGGTALLQITAAEGQTQYAGWTVPKDMKAALLSVHVTVNSNKLTNFHCHTRENVDVTTAPVSAPRLKLNWDGIQAPGFTYKPYGPELIIPEKTDIWFEAYGDGAVSAVSVNFELLVYDA